MANENNSLIVQQIDRKVKKLSVLNELDIPTNGWINAIRTAIGMSLLQLANRLQMTKVGIREIEVREENKSITLKKLMEVGEALGLQFVYGFIPKDSSIEAMIDKRALEVAREIVMRTSHTMKLEEQGNTEKRLRKAIKDRAEQIKREMPRYLWD